MPTPGIPAVGGLLAKAHPAAAPAAVPVVPQLEDPWIALLHVPAAIVVEVPVSGLTVRELFRLEKDSIVSSAQLVASNVPLLVGTRLIAWGEFQVAGDRLAVRLAELA